MPSFRQIGAGSAALVVGCWLGSSAVMADSSPTPSPSSSPKTSPPPAPAKLAVSPTSGAPYSGVTLTGSGFPPNAFINPYVDAPNQSLGLFGNADGVGNFSDPTTITANPGARQICAETVNPAQSPGPKVTACAPFTVTAYQPSIAAGPDTGPYGTTILVTGAAFPPNEKVVVYSDAPNSLAETSTLSDGQGNFRVEAGFPRGDGPHNLCADTGEPAGTQSWAAKACTEITTTASPTSGPPASSPSPTFAAPPVAANVAATSLPVWPIAGGAAALLSAGGGALYWRRRRSQPKDR